MKTLVENSAKGLVGARLMKGFRLRWLFYGVAAYYGIRYLNKKGILPKQTDAALNLMDKGIDFAKSQIGIEPSEPKAMINKTLEAEQDMVRH